MPDVMFLIECLNGNEFRSRGFWTLRDDLFGKLRGHDEKQAAFEYLPCVSCCTHV